MMTWLPPILLPVPHLPFIPHSEEMAYLSTAESSSDIQQQDGDSLSRSLWKTGNGIVYQAESSPVCFVQASL